MKSNCDICGAEIYVTLCCSGIDCGCMGMPIEMPVCSEKCQEAYRNRVDNPEPEPIITLLSEHSLTDEDKEWLYDGSIVGG